ncbi:MAG: ATP-binding protein [Betaproteobacteria bacterium]|jgi:predicted AAA+ superfamily ATPase|nr:ATP-binding protein [Rubrivivax sp.]
MPFSRHMTPLLRERAARSPVVTVTGPRQSGKTTLCRQAFGDLPYANLERPDIRDFAQEDPRSFLQSFAQGGVIDEIQRVPALLSWIQAMVDEQRPAAPLVFTGSHQIDLLKGVSQSLAGRTSLLQLLPMSVNEIREAGLNRTTDALIHQGGYPRIHAEAVDPSVVLSDYFATYAERDLRQLMEVRRLDDFRRFVRLAAGLVGQVLNVHSLAADAGVSDRTARDWLSVLEASHLVWLLPPWHENLGKRLTKAHKLYFCDVGLATWLVGITQAAQLSSHPLRGALFENLVVMEFVKHALHRGERPDLHFFRDSNGLEVDLLVGNGLSPGQLGLVEIKSGQTVSSSWFKPMERVAQALGPSRIGRRMMIYGGSEHQVRQGVEVVGFSAGALNAGTEESAGA